MFIPEDLVALLLHEAKIPQAVQHIQPIANQGITNHISLVTLQDGARYVVRHYQWPHGEPDLNRLQKEKYLHTLLRHADN